jgi:hypothetical protein
LNFESREWRRDVERWRTETGRKMGGREKGDHELVENLELRDTAEVG